MLIAQLGRRLAAILVHISFFEAVVIALLYAGSSYIGLRVFDESAITDKPVDFIYWLAVTGSTVGYGDLSPSTPAGKLLTSFYIIPVGLSLFAMLITRFGYFITNVISARNKGLSMIDEKDHCVIIGWTSGRTNRLIELLMSSSNGFSEKIVVCSEAETENPLPDHVEFTKVESFLNEAEMKRTGIEHARRIVIDLSSDDLTLTTALLSDKLNPNAHKTAYFHDDNIGSLLKQHCPKIEIVPSLSTELLARATLDPGSSLVHRQLLDSTEGVNQFSKTYGGSATTFGVLFNYYRHELDATLVGLRKKSSAATELNTPLDTAIDTGDTLYYYASSRIDNKPAFKEQPAEI